MSFNIEKLQQKSGAAIPSSQQEGLERVTINGSNNNSIFTSKEYLSSKVDGQLSCEENEKRFQLQIEKSNRDLTLEEETTYKQLTAKAEEGNLITENDIADISNEVKTSEQKFFELCKKLFEKDPAFTKLTPEKQQEFIQTKMQEIILKLAADNNKNPQKLSKTENMVYGMKAILLLSAAYTNGENGTEALDKLLSASAQQRNEIIKTEEKKYTKILIEKLENELPENTTNKDKLLHLADKILSMTDPEYAKLPNKDEKNTYLYNKAGEILKLFGITDWNEKDGKEKNTILENAGKIIITALKDGITLSEFTDMEPSKRLKVIISAGNFVDKAQLPQFSALNEILVKIGDKEPTIKNVLEYLNNNEENLTDGEQLLLGRLKALKELYGTYSEEDFENKDIIAELLTTGNRYQAVSDGCVNEKGEVDYDAYIAKNLNGKDEEEFRSTVHEMMSQLDLSEDFVKKLNNYLNKKGFSLEKDYEYFGMTKEDISLYFSTETINEASVGNIEGTEAGTRRIHRINPAEVARVSELVITVQAGNEAFATGYGEAVADIAEARIGVVNGLADRNNFSFEASERIYGNIYNSNNVSDSAKADYSRLATIASYQNSKEEGEKFRNFSLSQNISSVTEGVAAAKNSLNLTEAEKREYDNSVKSASANFTQEEQSRINTALKTGHITEYTASQTNVKNEYKETSAQRTQIAGNTSAFTQTNTQIYAQINPAYDNAAITTMAENTKETLEKLMDYSAKVLPQNPTEDEIVDTFFAFSTSDTNSESNQNISEEQQILGISAEKMQELKNAYNAGGIVSLYQKLSSIGAEYQNLFLNYFVRNASVSAIRTFARAYAFNNAIIDMLFEQCHDLAILTESKKVEYLLKGKIKPYEIKDYSIISKYITAQRRESGINSAISTIKQLLPGFQKMACEELGIKQGSYEWNEIFSTQAAAVKRNNDVNYSSEKENKNNNNIAFLGNFVSMSPKSGDNYDKKVNIPSGLSLKEILDFYS